MANKKLAPNWGKGSAAKEAGESALQLARSPPPGTRRRVPPSASDDAKNPPPAPAKKTPSASAKNTPPAPSRNTASASAKNKAPVPHKTKASASAKNKASASDGDEVAAPPQDTTLRRFKFLCEKAASMPWRGLLDAFLTWVHSRSSTGGKVSNLCSAMQRHPLKGSAHQEHRENNTQQQVSPQLPVERRRQNYAFKYGKDARRRKRHDCDRNEADRSVPTDLSISQAEADRIIPAGPSISEIVEDSQKFDRYLSSDIHQEYIKIMSSCPPGMEVCMFCYFEKGVNARRSQSNRISHVSDWHASLAGVKCTNCPARFPTEHVRDLHRMYCNA
ncbi:hypothetical protein ACQJBY_040197 [Aegilops geniculata]